MTLTKVVLFLSLTVSGLIAFANGRPNFTCQTSENAAKMSIQALIYTMYYSKQVKVELYHNSTYRSELIASETTMPQVQNARQLSFTLENEAQDSSSNSNDIFVPMPIQNNSIGYNLTHVRGLIWQAEIQYRTFEGSGFGNFKSKVRTYKMNCYKN